MFPIHSMSGRVLGFGGRILTNDKKTAKYLNSPESDIYHKSKILYGIFYAKQHIAKEDNCYLVEGYTDMIQMYQKGIKNVVASSGTALTSEQIRLIHRLTSNITILYDGDSAGLRASIRGVDLILEQGMNVRICTFPDGEDPDSFSKNNSLTEIKEYLDKNTQDFIRFKASILVDESKNDPLKRAETIRDMIGSISKIPDAIKREVYIRECASIMNISEEVLFTSLAQIGKQQIQQADRDFKKQNKNIQPYKNQTLIEVNPLVFLEKDLIKHLLLYGAKECIFEDIRLFYDEKGEEETKVFQQKLKVFEKFFLELQTDEIELSTPNFKNIFKLILDKYKENENFNINRYINEMPIELAQEVAVILAEDDKLQLHQWKEKKEIITKNKDADVSIAVNAIILRMRKLFVTNKIKLLQKELEEEVQNNEDFNSQGIIKEIMDYLSLQKLLNKRLNQVVN